MASNKDNIGESVERPVHELFNEFFTDCPDGREILAKSKSSHCPRHHAINKTNYVDDFFTECPYGRRAAEQCPYGHDILERAGIEVAPIENKGEAKCPFASLAAEGETCPVAHGTKKDNVHGKCPVGGVLPQSDRCPFSPNYKVKDHGRCHVGGVPQSEKCPFSPNYKHIGLIAVDLYESDIEFKFYVELPGIIKDNVKLEVKDNILTLSTDKGNAPEGYSPRFVERQLGQCSRSISLPDNVSADKIKADMENGLLTITVPKGVPSIAKSINIG